MEDKLRGFFRIYSKEQQRAKSGEAECNLLHTRESCWERLRAGGERMRWPEASPTHRT